MTYSPAISLIPKPLYGENLRKELTQAEWSAIRKALIAERGSKCEVLNCGKEEADTSRIKAHEEWEYDTTQTPAIARVTGIKLCCWHCHAVEHFGLTGVMTLSGELPNAFEDTVEHFCRLNGVGRDEFMAHALESFRRTAELSALEWRVDYGSYTAQVDARRAKRAVKG